MNSIGSVPNAGAMLFPLDFAGTAGGDGSTIVDLTPDFHESLTLCLFSAHARHIQTTAISPLSHRGRVRVGEHIWRFNKIALEGIRPI